MKSKSFEIDAAAALSYIPSMNPLSPPFPSSEKNLMFCDHVATSAPNAISP
jgi:hypothetical protein